jgi:hypothetical protein
MDESSFTAELKDAYVGTADLNQVTAAPSNQVSVQETTAVAPSASASDSSGMSTGAIVGIVVGALCVAALVAVGAVMMSKRQAPTTNNQATTTVANPSADAEGASPTDTV